MALDAAGGRTAASSLSGEDLCLYFSPGSCSRVTMIVLEEIGVPYRTRRVMLSAQEQSTPAFLSVNPKGKVPVLETPDGILTENVAIISHLASWHPQASVLPAEDRWARSKALADLAWFASTLHPLLTIARYPERFCDVADAAPRVRALTAAKLAAQIEVAERRLAAAEWFGGSDWSAADAYLYWSWERSHEAGLAASRYPRVAAHHARMQGRDSVKRALQREAVG